MDLDVRVTHEPGWTRVLLAGAATLGRLSSLMQVLEIDSTSWPHKDVVLDLRQLDTRFGRAEREMLQQVAERRLRTKRVEMLWAERG